MISSLVFAACASLVGSTLITDIQGTTFTSPLAGQTVHNVTGIVTGKSKNGFFIQGDRISDTRVSSGLNIFTTSTTIQGQVAIGDEISLTGKVSEFRTANSGFLTGTELESPSSIVVLSSGNTVTPIVLGVDRSPPTQQLTSLDSGADGFLSVPNNASQVEVVNPTLQPTIFGLDFWESLEGQLVTVKSPTVTDFENTFGEFWVYGDWPITGKNARGGITMTFGPDGVPDANPELVIIGAPLDGTKSPHVAIGQKFQDITGIVLQQFGFFYVMPLTAPVLVSSPDFTVPPTTITPSSGGCEVTIGDYNVDNMSPTSKTLPTAALHIASFLNSPDIVFVQEIQDNSGPTSDGTVIGNLTGANIISAIKAAGGSQYTFLEIAPVDGQDGGQPGGNIRQVYFYRPDKVKLVGSAPAGGALDDVSVVTEADGSLGLNFNPGRIDPTSTAWNSSRKPLVALWEPVAYGGAPFFTINLHLTAKVGSSSFQGDARPPVNLGVDQRTAQVTEVANFVQSILAKDPHANIIVGGDCNEFIMARSVFAPFDSILSEVDEVAGIEPVERYTYVFDQQNEQLDHIFVSNVIAKRGVEVEHVHVNNFAQTISARSSDHDPTIAKLKIC